MAHAVAAENKDETVQDFIRKFFYYHRNSYKNCCRIYCPGQPRDNELGKLEEEPVSALYYALFGGLTNRVIYLLSEDAGLNVQGEEYCCAS